MEPEDDPMALPPEVDWLPPLLLPMLPVPVLPVPGLLVPGPLVPGLPAPPLPVPLAAPPSAPPPAPPPAVWAIASAPPRASKAATPRIGNVCLFVDMNASR